MNMKAIIFDLDGVICDTDEYHYLAWKQMADSIGVSFDRAINNRLRGVSRMESLNIILEKCNVSYSPHEKETLAAQKNDLYKNYLAQMTEKDLSTEVFSTLTLLRKMGYKLAIGSSSKNAPMILKQLGLENFFDVVSDGNNISNSKPDPEVFITAAKMLNIQQENCLVVEDAVSGVEAAHRAKMQVACLGNAAKAKAGDYNMTTFSELPKVLDSIN